MKLHTEIQKLYILCISLFFGLQELDFSGLMLGMYYYFFVKIVYDISYSPSMNLKVEYNGWIDCNDLNGTNKRYYCRSSADISLEHAHKGSFVRWFSCWTCSTSKSVLRKKVSGYITCFTLISSNWWCVEGISHLIWNNPNLYEQWPSNPLRTQPQALCPHHKSTHIHTRTHTIIHKHH